MSDVSILSQEYETAAQLSQKINRVAIYLKKKSTWIGQRVSRS